MTVYLAETGKGKRPVIRCKATITDVVVVEDLKTYNRYRKQCKVKAGSAFDYIPGKKKYLYKLENVQAVEPFTPPEGKRHGYVWMEYNGKEVSAMKQEKGDYKQWIADVYHCSGCWGHRMTVEDMYIDLSESRKEADPDDYVPDASLAKECAAYWNKLCKMFPG